MEAFGDRLKVIVKVFRRECHRVLHSERTTIHGADGMLMLLQLAMAEVNKQVKMSVRRVFCSYLNLLVNAKNDMALALTLDVPSRTLGRQAFTDVKHAAHNNSTSLFLAVTSFVRVIQLGGKGYAPAESDPLRKHVKGLSDFVHFLDDLEEILGEIPDPSVCGARLVAAVRAVLVKGRSSGDAMYAAADETTKELKERICQLHQIQKLIANGSGTGISPARPKAYVVNHCTAYGGRDTVKVLMALLDEEALTPPCRNKADLLSEDQPVLSGAEGTCILNLFRSPEVSTGCSPEPLKNRVQSRLDLLKPKPKDGVIRSQFACTYNEELPLNRVLEFPSSSQVPTCVHPAPKPQTLPTVDEECSSDVVLTKAKSTSECPNKEQSGVQQGAALGPRSGNGQNRVAGPGDRKKTGTQARGKGNKRKQVDSDQRGGSENEPPEKKPFTSVKMPGKNVSKASSKKKLIAGQGKLTSFFRV
ncbi:PCNA-interacting partner isoform X3 [Cottoperca gobio]|uniref:PCNA-interacting partner n=1 Tax=Cottoperca gobio TaxID=56716 RepID=A0A6J2S7X1_COTGO|nr:PCNA-interacting partner isoform X3 [Cottoperca gobio]